MNLALTSKDSPILSRRYMAKTLLTWLSSQKALGVEVQPLYALEKDRLLSISPDGMLMCVVRGGSYSHAFRLTGSGWKDVTKSGADGSIISIVRIQDNVEVFSLRLAMQPIRARYFPASDLVWVQGRATRDRTRIESIVLDVPNKRILKTFDIDSSIIIDNFAEDESVVEWTRDLLRKVTLDGKILQAVTDVPQGVTDAKGRQTAAAYSLNRQIMAYGIGYSVVLRQVVDLSVRWIHDFGSKSWLVSDVGLSFDGAMLAVHLIDSNFNHTNRRSKVLIVEGATGKVVHEFPVDGSSAFGMSADGSVIAVGARHSTRTLGEGYHLSVIAYSTGTGEKLATLHHDRVMRSESVMATYFQNDSIRFTADGKYLITTGRKTKVWKCPG